MRRRKIRKFADREQSSREQTDREHFKNWGHSNPLWIVGGAGQYIDKGSVILKFAGLSMEVTVVNTNTWEC